MTPLIFSTCVYRASVIPFTINMTINPKRHLIASTLVVTLLSVVAAPAQAGPHYIGARGGVNFATVDSDAPASFDGLTRGVFGFASVFTVSKWIALQPEVLISGKGTEGDVPVSIQGAPPVMGKAELSYLEIPLLVRLLIPVAEPLRPYAYAGPALSANLSASADVQELDGTPVQLPGGDDRIDEYVSDGEFSLVAGLGVGFPVRGMALELDGRYTHGLSSIDDTDSGFEPKNRVWAVTLGVLFEVGGDE